MYYICTFVYTCVCRYAYRIAGKTGREKTVWQCKLKFVNVKFVMLKKKQYKTT